MSKYKITRMVGEDKNAAYEISFSYTGKYLTDIFGEDGNKIKEGYIANANLIMNGEDPLIPEADYDIWEDAVIEYVQAYNKNLAEAEIEYELLEKRDDSTYIFNKKLNGKIVTEKGNGTIYKLWNENDKAAWRKAVEKYNSEHEIQGASDIIKEKENEIKKKIAAEDTQFPAFESPGILPTIPEAITSLPTEPCTFIENIMKATGNAVIPNPLTMLKEQLAYAAKIFTKDTKTATDIALHGDKLVLELEADEMFDVMDPYASYFDELNASHETFIKEHPIPICKFNVIETPSMDEITEAVEAAQSTTTESGAPKATGGTSFIGNIKITTPSNYDAWCRAWNDFGHLIGLKDQKAYYTLLGQLLHESARFRYMEEIGQGKTHDYGKAVGPYKKIYYGRGPIQVTWIYNYENIYNKFIKDVAGRPDINIYKNPELCSDPYIGSLASIGWLYLRKGIKNALNTYDIERTTKLINGGQNGIDQRRKYTHALWGMLS